MCQHVLRNVSKSARNVSSHSEVNMHFLATAPNTIINTVYGYTCVYASCRTTLRKKVQKLHTLTTHTHLLSLPFCSSECLSVLDRSVHTYVFLRVMALAGMLFWRKNEM